ncbi:TetR family transcriptional regulator [Flavobacterium rakeshii]|uniref:TetR family transcriptional regulator n=1 Tax=Flavobacterium rakeshii TaxID=1038845 RepID=A0A6N8HAS5_9FLAO|nr:TetR/AcrR family transcriptional regulator [Flavobacterium rakeshii]MEE1896717.1 TetR/AcrR family transcriptional regulator [Flavobacterium rakeshii]MUV03749.1 TetR family transcriptional regulator [Flavobacterium rakeshii]
MRTRDTDKEKLVYEKAIEQIVKEGFNAFSMNKLAKACNISVATLYIYYKDKDDLIKKVGTTIAKKFFSIVINDFNPKMPFEEGMWIQWKNRSAFALENPMEVSCFEIMKHSPYADEILKAGELTTFKECMTEFFKNAIKNKELNPISLDIFWSIAYGPLYSLLGFHREGKSIGGRPFTLTEDIMKETFDLMIKGLKP